VVVKSASEAVGSLLPYVESTFHFKNKKLKAYFPDGFHFRFGLGTTAVTSMLMGVAALLVLDKTGIIDKDELAAELRAAFAVVGGDEEEKSEGLFGGLKWYEMAVPITIAARFLK
jgi:hypothetical protein